jgi:hypothetical protein
VLTLPLTYVGLNLWCHANGMGFITCGGKNLKQYEM